jgi:hypothetical protein
LETLFLEKGDGDLLSLGRIWSFWEREFERVELRVFLTSSIFGGEKLEDLAGVWKVESPFESGVWRVEEFFCLVVKTKSGKKFVRVLRGGRKGSLSLFFGETQN